MTIKRAPYSASRTRSFAGSLLRLRKLSTLLLASPLLLFSLPPQPCCAQEFALRDNDTVVFLGDSITAALTYGKIVENYTLLHYPERKVHFLNMGWAGDTAEGGLKRLQRDVFDKKATVLLVAYGINDIGWGMKANEEHKQRYLTAIRGIVEQCKQRGVRVFICSAAITGADPAKSENDFLQKMCDEGMAQSRSLGQGSIDVQRTMRDIQRKVWKAAQETTNPKEKPSLHTEDTIHLNDYGQIAMAYAIIKGLGAPAEVSSATLDARTQKATGASGCSVSKVSGSAQGIEFTRLDKHLPLNLGLIGHLSYRFVPIPDEINRYMLTVKNLETGDYELVVNERLVGKYSSQQLEAGVNIGSATPDPWEPGGPWDAQAAVLRPLTDARSELMQSTRLSYRYMAENPNQKALVAEAQRQNKQLEELQRQTAKPVPYRFVVRKATEKAK